MVGRSEITTGAWWTPPKMSGADHRVLRHATGWGRGEARQERHHRARRCPPRPLAYERRGPGPEPRRRPRPPPQRRPPDRCRCPRPHLRADLVADGRRRHALRPASQRQRDPRREEQAPPEHPARNDDHDRLADQAEKAPNRDFPELRRLTHARRSQRRAPAQSMPVDGEPAVDPSRRNSARDAVIRPDRVHGRQTVLPELDGNRRVNDT